MQQTNILVVEDETLIAWNIKNILEKLGYRVLATTGEGNEAVKKVEELKPDLVLMDIKLQGQKSGIEAAAEIHKSFGTPVIYLTSHSDDTTLEELKTTMPYGYIPKTFNERTLKVNIDIAIYKFQAERELLRQSEEISRLNRKLEKQLQREEEMRKEKEELLISQAKMAAMGEMLEVIAHQWRQPLNTIGLLNQGMEEICIEKGIDCNTIEDVFEKSFEQIQFLSSTIDDFRNFLKPPTKMLHFSIGSALRKTKSLLMPLLNFNHITLDISQEFQNELFIKGHMNEFQQVVYNLVNNSCEAILEKKSTIPDLQGEIKITVQQENNNAIVTVLDNGKGLPVEVVGNLCEPHFTTKKKGTGIGLHIAKMIIEQKMKGIIQCKNRPQGASFIITLQIQSVTS